MRKTKQFLLMAAMLLGSLTASAYDFKVDGICYNILSSTDLTVEVTFDVNNIKYEGSISIPSRVSQGGKEYTVKSVGDHAFVQCVNLSSVTIPWGVTEIGQQAFAYCYNLTSITIPSSITTIWGLAFEYCRSLTSISIPNKVTRIRQSTFRGCEKLTSVTIPASVNTIELWAFQNCSALNTIAIPSSVTSIEQQAFAGCSKLASVYSTAATPPTLGNSVFEEISSSAKLYVPKNSETAYTDAGWSSYFSQVGTISGTCGNSLTWTLCSDGELTVEGTGAMTDYSYSSTSPWTQYKDNITRLTIKDGVTSIGNRAFSECSLLTSASLPEGLTEIGTHAFYYCESLTTVNIPSTVTSIGMCAFMYCDFTEISLPKGITKIQNSTFTGTSLKTVEIPEGVTEIGENSFCACKALESITLPSSVTTIGNMAFQFCENLNSVTIPENVTSIGTYAFDECKSLTSITIPECVTSISKNAFSDCANLVSVIVPEGVIAIGEYAFARCTNLTSVIIPESVTSIGGGAFELCVNLASVSCFAATPPTIGVYTFNQISSSVVLYVPGSAINQYKTTNYWKSFRDIRSNITWTLTDEGELIIEGVGKMTDSPWSGKKNLIKSVTIKDGVTSICSNAFNDCESLTSITIPESVIEIGSRAFNGCINLSSITIPKGITSIGSSTFSNCENLKSISFSENSKLNSIGSYAFYYCVSLASIEIPEGVTSIGTYAFDECVNLTSITIPTTVTEIGNYAFNDCNCIILKCPNIGEWFGQNEAIKEVVLGETVISVGDRAFQYCYNLASLTISESVTNIGNSAFYCTGITSITIPENSKLTSIGGSAFGGCRSISSITCELKTPPTITSTTFANIDKSIPLYVPQPSVSVYQSAPYWNEFSNIIGVIPENQSITINQYGSGTYCSEYALDFSEVEGLKAYAATGYNTRTGVVTLTRVMTAKAGEGLFIKGEPGDYMVPVMEDTDDNTLNMLVGTLTNTDLNGTSTDGLYTNYKYTIKMGDAEPMFYQFDDGSTLSAERAYLQIPTKWLPQTESKAIRLRFVNGATTNIEEIESTENGEQSTAIYDLMGRRVENPSKGCVYIVNGCKVIY